MAGSTPTWGCSSSVNHNPPKKQVWTVDPWHVQQVEPQTLIMEKIIMEKIIMEKPVNPWFHRKNQLWKKWNYGKKKGSDHFRDILNFYGEKPNYGKIGRRRRLSKLNVFFSIILSVTIYIRSYSYYFINLVWLYKIFDQFRIIFK